VVHAPVECVLTPTRYARREPWDGDQGVDPGEEQGVYVHGVHGEDGLACAVTLLANSLRVSGDLVRRVVVVPAAVDLMIVGGRFLSVPGRGMV
jgi:hypothetical protein